MLRVHLGLLDKLAELRQGISISHSHNTSTRPSIPTIMTGLSCVASTALSQLSLSFLVLYACRISYPTSSPVSVVIVTDRVIEYEALAQHSKLPRIWEYDEA